MFVVFVERLVGNGFDLGVVMLFSKSEFEAGDFAACEMGLAADESKWPGGIERECVSEQQDRSCDG